MSCEICGKNNCTRSYHSLEAQENFDNIADKVEDRVKRIIANKIDRIMGHYHGDNYYIKLADVLNIIDDYD